MTNFPLTCIVPNYYTVHNMNEQPNQEISYRSLLLLEEISKEEPLSQRDLSKRVGIAVGLVNSYVKNFVAKGYVRVSSFPKNRYKYLLTPKGVTEKTRLTYQHLHYFTNLYTTARKDFKTLFSDLERDGVKTVLFCGVDEVAEIAYLSLQETNIELIGVIDTDAVQTLFFRYEIAPIEEIRAFNFDRVIVTSLKRQAQLFEKLEEMGLEHGRLCRIKK